LLYELHAKKMLKSSETVTIRLASESWICLSSSETVYKGLQVVTTAPMATTARKKTGKRIELGANSENYVALFDSKAE
jgi:hypothetical protein